MLDPQDLFLFTAINIFKDHILKFLKLFRLLLQLAALNINYGMAYLYIIQSMVGTTL